MTAATYKELKDCINLSMMDIGVTLDVALEVLTRANRSTGTNPNAFKSIKKEKMWHHVSWHILRHSPEKLRWGCHVAFAGERALVIQHCRCPPARTMQSASRQ
jgi:hypothetical protein